jgi:hypothetical protein
VSGRDRVLTPVGWVLAISVSLVLASCGGPSDAEAAIIAAEKALPGAELWDSRTGDVVAKPAKTETLDAAAFDSFVQAEPDRAAHLQMAAEMGYPTVLAAGRVTYDNGAIMTTAALAGEREGDIVMLVVGLMPGDATTPEPPEAIFIAKPVYENGKFIRVDFSSEKGALSLDVASGQVDLANAEYGSCASWNCLAGAIFFWWEDNSTAMDAYWGTAGEACMDCIVLPFSQPVTCPVCAVFIGAPILASVTNCTIWPCDLCVSDGCHAPEYENQRCVTEDGVGSSRRSVTPWVCENPRTQQSECVPGTPTTEIEWCQWGCKPGSPACQFSMECMVGGYCPDVASGAPYCVGNDLQTRYQGAVCHASSDPQSGGKWGTCEPAFWLGSSYLTQRCPYTCANGACQPPPTCDPAICGKLEKPLGETSCTVRPDDGESVVVQQVQPYGCVTVQPDPAAPVVPPNWLQGQSCQPLDSTLRVIETCPGECAEDGMACAPFCEPSTCQGTKAAETSCNYDYNRYKRYQQFETSVCQPLDTGGSTCAVEGDLQEVGLCLWGCTADGSDCAPDTGVPEAPGDFMVLEGSAPGKTEFVWADTSLDEQGFVIYHGGCFATPTRPCSMIAKVDANEVQVLLDWQRPEGSDRCWEIRSYNATGESAPVWYCLP